MVPKWNSKPKLGWKCLTRRKKERLVSNCDAWLPARDGEVLVASRDGLSTGVVGGHEEASNNNDVRNIEDYIHMYI
jgi:hypothetical protein